MSLNVIAIVLSAVTLGLGTYLLLKLRDQNTLEKGNTDNLQTKLDLVWLYIVWLLLNLKKQEKKKLHNF